MCIRDRLQTAPGQLSVTTINPEIRPEFSAFTRLQEFQMLTKTDDIKEFFADIEEELVEIDSLLQGRYTSLIDLRKEAQQPVGKLRLVVVQDLPQLSNGDLKKQLLKILKSAPRAGRCV